MVDFTKNIEQRTYQPSPTSGAVSKEGLVKPGLIGDIAKGLSMGIEIGTELDKQSVVREATDAAEQLSEEYLKNSPTYNAYLQNQKALLEQQGATVNAAGKDLITNQINNINNRLLMANAQGTMTPSEAIMRSSMTARQIASRNPAYRGEITKAMENYYQTMGVKTVMDADQALFNKQAAAAEKRITKMTELVAKYDPYVYDMNEQQLSEAYKNYAGVEVLQNGIKLVNDNAKEWQKYSANEQLNILGGYDKFPQLRAAIYQNLTDDLAVILDRTDIPTEKKRQEGLNKIQEHKIKFEGLSSKFYNEEDKRSMRFINQMDAMFTDLSTNFDGNVTGDTFKKITANNKDILQNTLDIQFMTDHGITQNQIEWNKNLVEYYKLVKQGGVTLPNSAALAKNIEGLLDGSIMLNYTPMSLPDNVADIIGYNKGKNFNATIQGLIKNLPKDKQNNNGAVPDVTINMMNNQLAWINSIEGDNVKRIRVLDDALKTTLNIKDEDFLEIVQKPGYYQQFNSSMRLYGGLIIRNLKDLKEAQPDLFKVSAVNIYENGVIKSDNNLELDRHLERINTYVKLLAKKEQRPTIDVLKERLTTDFSFLEIPGYSAAPKLPKISSEKDREALPKGTRYIDLNDNEKVKQ